MVSWFIAKYSCCMELARWLAESLSAKSMREFTHMFMSQFAVNGKRKICRISKGIIMTYSMAMCAVSLFLLFLVVHEYNPSEVVTLPV